MFVSYSFSSFCECPRVNTIINLPQESVFSLFPNASVSLSLFCITFLDVVLITFIMYLCTSFFSDRFLIFHMKMLTQHGRLP